MAQATFKIGERVLCYETDPGKVNKLYQAVVNQVDQQQKTFLVHFCGWGHRWDRRVERAFLLKDSEINRRLMKQINSQAEKKKGARIKEKVDLEEEQNKLMGGKNLRKGVKMKEELGLTEEKLKKLKGFHKEKVLKCGAEEGAEEVKVQTSGTGLADSEQVSKARSSRLRNFQPSGSGVPSKWEERRSSRLRNCKAKRRSRSGLWEVNEEMTSKRSKLLGRETAAQERKVRTMRKEIGSPAGNLAKVERMPGSQKVERGKLRNVKHRVEKEISAQGSDQSALQTGIERRSVKPVSRWKTSSNTCAVCSAMATCRHYSAWSCHACALFFQRHVTSKEPCRPCKFGGKCDPKGTNRSKCQSCRLMKCFEAGMDAKCVQHNDKSESLKDATLAITAASRSTHTGQHMSRGRKKARREIEAEPASCMVNPGEVKSRDFDGKAGPRRTQKEKHTVKGKKRAMSEEFADFASQGANLEEAAGVRHATATEEYSLGLIDQGLEVPEAEVLAVSGECRPFKRRKSERMTTMLNSVGAVRETNQAEAEADVDEVKAKEVSKFNRPKSSEAGDVDEAAVRQPMKWKMEVRPALKKILERDHELVMKKGKRHRLPASPNIVQLLGQFVKDASLRRLSDLEKLLSKLDKLKLSKRRASKQIAAAEEELDNHLQTAEATILPLRELSDALQTIADQRLEKTVLYPGEAARSSTVTPPAQPTIYHNITEGPLTFDSLRQSILAWAPTPASLYESPPSSLVYGGFLRMLVRLPDIFAQMDFQPQEAALIKSLVASLQKYLDDIAGQFVRKDQYQ